MTIFRALVTNAIIHNRTTKRIKYEGKDLKHGDIEFSDRDDLYINAGENGGFVAGGNGILTGTEGFVKYSYNGELISIYWDTPIWRGSFIPPESEHKVSDYYYAKCDSESVFCCTSIDGINSTDVYADYYIYGVKYLDNSQPCVFERIASYGDKDKIKIEFSDPPFTFNNENIVFHIENLREIVPRYGQNISMQSMVNYKDSAPYAIYKNTKLEHVDRLDIFEGMIEFPAKNIINGFDNYLYFGDGDINETHKNHTGVLFTIKNKSIYFDNKDFKTELAVGREYTQKIEILPSIDDVELTFNSILELNGKEVHIKGLPPGLSISSSDRFTITGTPERSGVYHVTITARRERDDASDIMHLKMIIAHDAMDINITSLGGAFIKDNNIELSIGESCFCELVISKGYAPYTIAISNKDQKKPPLPIGLELRDTFILGTPQDFEAGEINVMVSDRYGNTVQKKYVITVDHKVKILPETINTINTSELQPVKLKFVFGNNTEATDEQVSFILTSEVDNHFSIKNNYLVPEKGIQPGLYAVAVAAVPKSYPSIKYRTKDYVVAVGEKIKLSDDMLPVGVVRSNYEAKIKIENLSQFKDGSGLSMIITGLPSGLYQNPDFSIKGVPLHQGSYSINVLVTDAITKQDFASQTYNIIIDGPPEIRSILNRSFPTGKVSIPLSDYVSSNSPIIKGVCSSGVNSIVKGVVSIENNVPYLIIDIPDNTRGDVTMRYSVENKHGESKKAIIQFKINQRPTGDV